MKKEIIAIMSLVVVLFAQGNSGAKTISFDDDKVLVEEYNKTIMQKHKEEQESQKVDEIYYNAMDDGKDTLQAIKEILDMINHTPKYIKKSQIRLLKQELYKLQKLQRKYPNNHQLKQDIEDIKYGLSQLKGGN